MLMFGEEYNSISYRTGDIILKRIMGNVCSV